MARKCGGCGAIGHNKRCCPALGKTLRVPWVPKGTRHCAKCGQGGHNARTCVFSAPTNESDAQDVSNLDLNALAQQVYVVRPCAEDDLLMKNAAVFERNPAYCRPVDCEFVYDVGDYVVVKYPWYEFVIVGRISLINYETGHVIARSVDTDGPNASWNFKRELRPGMKVERFARDKKYITKPVDVACEDTNEGTSDSVCVLYNDAIEH